MSARFEELAWRETPLGAISFGVGWSHLSRSMSTR